MHPDRKSGFQTLALCLSSAGSLVQGHKREGWNLRTAISAMGRSHNLIGNRSILVPSVTAQPVLQTSNAAVGR